MLHRFRFAKDTKTADEKLGRIFEVEQVFDRKLFEAFASTTLAAFSHQGQVV
jgi:hypothetical protein